jgi:predicted metalloprotease
MRWRDQRESDNVEDQRSFSGRGLAVGGGLGGMVLVVVGLSTPTVSIWLRQLMRHETFS